MKSYGSTTVWQIEEWISHEHATGGKGFWWMLKQGICDVYEVRTKREALDRMSELISQGRKVRLVQVTREVFQ